MRKPKRPALNRSREHRIEQEIAVDAYASNERALWRYWIAMGYEF
jgi:hypothetical protein